MEETSPRLEGLLLPSITDVSVLSLDVSHEAIHSRTSVLDEYKPYLDERWDESCTHAWKLWEEIVPLGYRGSYGRVSGYVREKRTSPRPVTAQPPTPRVVTR